MASEFDTLFDEVARPAMFEYHAEAVTHRPLGVSANDVATTAVFDEADPARDVAGGRQVFRRGTLFVDDALSVATADEWLIRGLLWQTLDVATAAAGMIEAEVQRVEDETRTSGRTVL